MRSERNLWVVFALLLAGCGQAEPSAPPPTPIPPTRTSAPEPAAVAEEPAPPGEPIDVEVPGAEGLVIHGRFYPPPAPSGPAVLLLHMYGGSKADWEDLSLQLQVEGIGSLAIDLRGHGETAGAEDWQLAREDVRLARDWLASRPEVSPHPTGVLGASIGANLTLWLGAEEPSIPAIGLLSPGFEYFRVSIEGEMERYGDRPSLLVASVPDTYSAETVQALADVAVGPVDLALYEEPGHGTDLLTTVAELPDRIVTFFLTYLAP